MKKIYKSLSLMVFVAACSGAMAQAPTITSTAMPQIGYSYFMKSDTASTVTGFTVSAGSASAQTWNYTTGWDSLYDDTTAFVNKSLGAGNSNFPSATMASPSGGNWAYWASGSGLVLDGYYGMIQGSAVSVDLVPNMTQIPIPFTYGSSPITNDCAATFTISFSGFPLTVNHRVRRTITADAFGSLTTPTATYPNTLRIKVYDMTSDSIYAFGTFQQAQYDTTTAYSWLQNNQSAQVMEIDLNRTGTATKASYLQTFSNGIATIGQPTTGFNLYPNPATDVTYFTYENKTTGMVNIQLLDVTGKQVAVVLNEQQAIGKQNVSINLAALHLPKGMYFVQLNSTNNLQTIKLTVQ
ncbi:MAG: T9SS type A sorting domain-containing protein [Bacteroidia bacterium]